MSNVKSHNMSNFLYLFRGGQANYDAMSAAEKEAHMKIWFQWMGNLRENGTLIDGLPLAKEGKVVENRGEIITDGPFAEGSEMVGGYLIVSAGSLDEAVEISKGCPIFDYGGTTEVREILSME
jgi:hypothetical protein